MIHRLLGIVFIAGVLLGCGRVESPSQSAMQPVVFNPTAAPTVALSVPDMMCEDGCAVKVREILSKQAGARDVIVNFDAKRATVAIEEGVFQSDAAVAALVDYGFDNSRLQTPDVAKPQAAVH